MGDVFPQYYVPRSYQAEGHRLFRTKRISLLVYPRQTGKDVCLAMENVEARLRRSKTLGVYVAPDAPSARNILWDKTYYDPQVKQQIHLLQDNVPTGQMKNNGWKDTRMEGVFHNNSKLKLEGYFQSGKDKNGVGTSFDDYSFTELSLFTREDPVPRLLPIINSGNGFKRLMAVGTPRGKRSNPLWQLIQSEANNPMFGYLLRTIDDINEMQRKAGLPVVLTEAELESTKESYARRFGNSRMFEQEYYCSFEEMDAAAVYGLALEQMLKERRSDPFNWARDRPIFVVFDIGSSGVHSDATAWIAFQWYNEKLFLIDCGEGHGMALPEYVDVLAQKPWYNQMTQIILPWDAESHDVGVRETPADMMRKRFANVAVLAKGTNIWTAKGLPNTGTADIITMVQQVRLQMYNTYINGQSDALKISDPNRPNCDWLIECMENYKYAYNHKLQMWSEFPVHDKYSHMMDALRYAVQAVKELDYFKGNLYNSGMAEKAMDYEETWSW